MPEVIESKIAYLALKAAHKLYGKAPGELQSGELERVQHMAQQQHELELRMLENPEALGVMVPPETLKSAMQEIQGRYPNDDEFASDLLKNGMSEAGFEKSLGQELKAKAILTKIGARAGSISDIDVELYYQYHPDQFRHPETRAARHILITVNDAIPENTRSNANKRMAEIGARLAKQPGRFEEQALKHSECPTALNGGKLGELVRGKLFDQLDCALFEMKAGDISGVIETELGLHILRCDAITEAGILGFDQARAHIRKLMEKKRRLICQRAWIKQLLEKKPNA